MIEDYKQNGLDVFTFFKSEHSKTVTLDCDNTALYQNSTAGIVFETNISKILPFYCKYNHRSPKILDFGKIEEENQNKSCPLNFTYIPNLPDPCIKSLEIGGTFEETESFCKYEGGEIVDLSTSESILTR